MDISGREVPDERLVALIEDGNRMAFEAIFNRYWDKLYTAAYKAFADEVVSEDVVQEIFIDLWERRNTVEIQSLKAYLYQSVRNKVAKHIRKTRFTVVHEMAMEECAQEDSAQQLLEFEELQKMIDQSLEKLPERCKEVFQLSRQEQLSNKEIATRLDISIRTVETHISYALKHLRSTMGKEVSFSTFILLILEGFPF